MQKTHTVVMICVNKDESQERFMFQRLSHELYEGLVTVGNKFGSDMFRCEYKIKDTHYDKDADVTYVIAFQI